MPKYFPIYNDPITNTYLKDNIDIDITPFTKCNLDCPFCEVKNINGDYNEQWFKSSIDSLSVLLNDCTVHNATIAIAGGEIFHDRYFRYELWDQWLTDFTNILNVKQISYSIVIITNLITHHIDDIIKLVKKHHIRIGTSFDLEGRFTKQTQVDMFLANLQKLVDNNIVPGIATILHKKNIDAIRNENHWLLNTFKTLYNRFDISMEYYTDVNKLSDYNPSERDIIEFLQWCSIHYPKLSILTKYQNKKPTATKCSRQTIDIKPNHVSWECCNKTVEFAKMVSKFDCLSCDYMTRCGQTCPVELTSRDVCIDKAMYQFYENRLSIS